MRILVGYIAQSLIGITTVAASQCADVVLRWSCDRHEMPPS